MKTYWFRFGAGDPRTYSGLSPTLLFFTQANGATLPGPTITEATGTGLYSFQYGTTVPIAFLADAATTSPGTTGRYVTGVLDPVDRADEYGTTTVALGNTGIALTTAYGSSNISLTTAYGNSSAAQGVTILAAINAFATGIPGLGSTTSSFGTLTQDPVDLFGYVKRIIENLEGTNNFIKSSGALSIVSRATTGSVTLALKTIANSVSMVVKS